MTQPQSQTVNEGSRVTFTVGATGTAPLSYQWMFNGANVAGATASSLELGTVHPDQAGNYSVVVANSVGSITSSNAVLTVTLTPTCATVPSGLVSWWRGEGNAEDYVGSNEGAMANAPTFTAGKVGSALNLNGVDQFVVLTNSASLNPTGSFSIEAWIYPNAAQAGTIIGKWGDDGDYANNRSFLFSLNPDRDLMFAIADYWTQWDPAFQLFVATNVITLNSWNHVAAIYDQTTGTRRLYVNGVQVAQRTDTPITILNGIAKAGIGANFATSTTFREPFNGRIDELSLYSKALSSAEILAIYQAGEAGKCVPPEPPSIVTQPISQTVPEGSKVTFAVAATGTSPLSYQWVFNGTSVEGATTAALELAAVGPNQSGTYSVVVSNPLGSVTSSNAVLTVTPPPTCIPPLPGLVSWWRAESNGVDQVGGNAGDLLGAVSFQTGGEVGTAFWLNGTDAAVKVKAASGLNVGTGTGMTIECWINPEDSTRQQPLVEWSDTSYGAHLWMSAPPPGGSGAGSLFANLVDTALHGHVITTPPGLVVAHRWQHVALTYDKTSGNAVLYVDGAPQAQAALGQFTPKTAGDVYLGLRPAGDPAGTRYQGGLDEVSIYGRALTESEIQAIYSAGTAGKCVIAQPPFITTQPANLVTTVGSTATLSVGVAGTVPLYYQWSRNGTPIEGATTASLTLTNVQAAQAGTYAVVVTNAWGSATSSNATLTVNFPPALVKVTSVTAPAAGVPVTVPVLLVANGNENALGFSLTFDPTRLTFKEVLAGSAVEAAPLVNSLQATAGRLGIAVALAPNATFPAGTQEIARVVFTPALRNTPTTSTVGFTDLPTKRQLSDAQAVALPATFSSGTVTAPGAQYEGDVSPRPNGDQALTVTDWVLAGRYAARLDYPTNAAEFQRADCAPLITSGDGLLTVSDWVQAGRFAAGLDPLAPIGGPTNEIVISGIPPAAKSPGPKDASSGRVVRVNGGMSLQDQPVNASVALEALGGENGLGFSVSFDASKLTYTSATLDSGATGATLNINAAEAAAGRLGFVLTLGTSRSFAAGTSSVVRLTFQPKPSVTGTFPLALGNQPVLREVCDTNALVCPATFADGAVVVNPYPSLRLSKAASEGLTLAWPRWATNFVVQETGGPAGISSQWTNLVVTPSVVGDENVVTLPITGETKFYRLQGQ